MKRDRKKTFIHDLDHDGKLFEVINACGYKYYVIEDVKGREWLSTMEEIEPMIENWNKNFGFTKE